MNWKDFQDEQPDEGQVIDAWCEYVDPETGKDSGFRLPNCWYAEGKVLHGQGANLVQNPTFWMETPKSPYAKPERKSDA